MMRRPMVFRLALVLMFAAVLVVHASLGPGNADAAPPAQSSPPAGVAVVPGEVVIQYRRGIRAADKGVARGRVQAAAKDRARARTGEERELVTLPPGLAVADAVRTLRGDPSIAFVEPNYLYFPDAVSNDPSYVNGSTWGMYGDATTPANPYGSQAGEAWAQGLIGSREIVVAVIDSGIDINHPDLRDNIWKNPVDNTNDNVNDDQNCSTSDRVKDDGDGEYVDPDTNCDAGGYIDDLHGWDFVNNDASVYDDGSADESSGHATHVAGTIGAVGGNGLGVAGVNWQVRMISV
jgi:subtilisin family serine protease